MENIFELAERCLYYDDIGEKLELTHEAYALCGNSFIGFDSNSDIRTIEKVKFPDKPLLMSPRNMPRRSFNSLAGKIAFFHALAHIEWVAIYLAWDIIYRFRNLPNAFYEQWLKVAYEESLHFSLISEYLKKMQVSYGDLPAHKGLWQHAENTEHDILARLAVVPRCMEARGLDVTPSMIEKFKALGDQESVAVLNRILKDEIGHVQIGSYWFKYFCVEQGFDHEEKYKQLISTCYIGKPKGPFNRELRQEAGFSNAEIDWLES